MVTLFLGWNCSLPTSLSYSLILFSLFSCSEHQRGRRNEKSFLSLFADTDQTLTIYIFLSNQTQRFSLKCSGRYLGGQTAYSLMAQAKSASDDDQEEDNNDGNDNLDVK